MEKRNLSFDALKGIAAFLVVVGHICMGLMQMNNEVILHDIIYSFHMPLFIFVTGFFLPKALSKIERISEAISFLQDKAVRLLIPLMFIPTLYFYITNGSWDSYIKILVGPHWFTYVLFSLYVWVLICYLIGRKVVKGGGMQILVFLSYLRLSCMEYQLMLTVSIPIILMVCYSIK